MITRRALRASLALVVLAGSSGLVAQTAQAQGAAPPSQLSLKLYRQQVPALANFGGVRVRGDGFGSAVAAVPGHSGQVYGLTDRGPNVDGPDGPATRWPRHPTGTTPKAWWR